MLKRVATWIALLAAVHAATATAEPVTWTSVVTKGEVRGELTPPPNAPASPLPTVIYLTHLAAPRVGQEPDDLILADFLKDGLQVVTLDYAGHPATTSPGLNLDINELRQAINGKKFLAGRVDLAHLYVLPEGCRLKRDVVFYETGDGAKKQWAMDIFYPSKPAAPVPMLMEITCDNENRMGTFSLAFCRDTLVEGALLAGFATAMVDHPVPAPYKGMFPMPDSTIRMKAAVRTLRHEGKALGANGEIGVIGFSRGSSQAALLATTNGRPEFEKGGLNPGESSDVQAALVHGERYDFMALTPVDGMYKRFEAAWGKREEKPEAWDAHSAIRYVTSQTPPMFLNTSDKEEVTYREQLALLDKKLTEAGVEHVYQVDADGRGHRVTTDPGTLKAIYSFFRAHLKER
jgi:hypothetical protein